MKVNWQWIIAANCVVIHDSLKKIVFFLLTQLKWWILRIFKKNRLLKLYRRQRRPLLPLICSFATFLSDNSYILSFFAWVNYRQYGVVGLLQNGVYNNRKLHKERNLSQISTMNILSLTAPQTCLSLCERFSIFAMPNH